MRTRLRGNRDSVALSGANEFHCPGRRHVHDVEATARAARELNAETDGSSLGQVRANLTIPRHGRLRARWNVRRPLAVATTRTVISFLVRVPVLSEHTTVAQPSVSTAGSLRIRAFFLIICCIPSARQIVTIAGRPSGTAATARPPSVSVAGTSAAACLHSMTRSALVRIDGGNIKPSATAAFTLMNSSTRPAFIRSPSSPAGILNPYGSTKRNAGAI